ncbi:hypothetical protein Afer_0990 [Acidimicrobium ferrooxidans DSM 10331]|uniref:Uncharacterized protein n=1 Tax=Acidimicrobium ferrooxidans (strain DSM 10331 / JCM 15462 / NBRC 103882 / ICP) TaxID=525909 RepID=C7LYX1_ACIFD|nr:hypothetical protein Afer_0990 [Acidimicrobium ferrooxidans DSM 10331]
MSQCTWSKVTRPGPARLVRGSMSIDEPGRTHSAVSRSIVVWASALSSASPTAGSSPSCPPAGAAHQRAQRRWPRSNPRSRYLDDAGGLGTPQTTGTDQREEAVDGRSRSSATDALPMTTMPATGVERAFWRSIAIAAQTAQVVVRVCSSASVSARSFSHLGGMAPVTPTDPSGRFLSVVVREEIGPVASPIACGVEVLRWLSPRPSTTVRQFCRNTVRRSDTLEERRGAWVLERSVVPPESAQTGSNGLSEHDGGRCPCREAAHHGDRGSRCVPRTSWPTSKTIRGPRLRGEHLGAATEFGIIAGSPPHARGRGRQRRGTRGSPRSGAGWEVGQPGCAWTSRAAATVTDVGVVQILRRGVGGSGTHPPASGVSSALTC